MKHTLNVKRGDIYYADLNPVVGSEQGNMRPVIIVQNDTGNAHSPTTQIIPLTAQTQKGRLPTHVPISKTHGLTVDSIALIEQLRTIDKSRLGSYIGSIGAKEQSAIDKALFVSFGIKNSYKLQFAERTLCPRCKSEYETSGYIFAKQGWQESKESCDYCQVGRGWNYLIIHGGEEQSNKQDWRQEV